MWALIDAVGEAAAPGQISFWRSAVALLPITVFMMLRGDFPAALRMRRPAGHALRSHFGSFSMGCSFLSLIFLLVANASALG
jgi:drug/metabolite transporter (DMT)-like permease